MLRIDPNAADERNDFEEEFRNVFGLRLSQFFAGLLKYHQEFQVTLCLSRSVLNLEGDWEFFQLPLESS